MKEKLKVLELFSGIGGMHFAVKESELQASVVAAVDINEVANSVYGYNFPSTNLLQRNIRSLTSKELNLYHPDVIMMSPPCQPFTRVGLKKDIQDSRTDSFMHILSILPDLHSVQYILLENVKGFETSEARNKLISTLNKLGFVYQEFLLSPHNFFIPNVRLRYYLIAKHKSRNFCFPVSDELMKTFPLTSNFKNRDEEELNGDSCATLIAFLNKKISQVFNLPYPICENFPIQNVIESDVSEEHFLLNTKTLAKYANILDIVSPDSIKSCCFTKAYGHYVEGTGSVFCPYSLDVIHQTYEKCKQLETSSEDYVDVLRNLKLRYFSPREIARLMCFPDTFQFPDSTTIRQKYRLLGNSINIHVVTLLFVLLISEE